VRSIAPDVDFASQIGHARVQITGKESLRPGTFATASIKVETNCDNIRVPLSALLFRQTPQDRQGRPKPVVLVVNNQGLVETRPVKYGLFAGNDVEIKSGLNLDDLVVVRAGTFLNDRDLVRPILVERP
jgi:HlyD family secretion protein